MPKKVAKRKLMNESQFQKEILTAFKNDANIKMFRRNVGGMPSQSGGYVQFGDKGMSDLWGWVVEHRCPRCNRLQEGTHFEIELKSVEGKLTVEQKNWIDFVSKHNGIAVVLRPIESDPVGLRERICRLLERQLCPKCYEQSQI